MANGDSLRVRVAHATASTSSSVLDLSSSGGGTCQGAVIFVGADFTDGTAEATAKLSIGLVNVTGSTTADQRCYGSVAQDGQDPDVAHRRGNDAATALMLADDGPFLSDYLIFDERITDGIRFEWNDGSNAGAEYQAQVHLFVGDADGAGFKGKRPSGGGGGRPASRPAPSRPSPSRPAPSRPSSSRPSPSRPASRPAPSRPSVPNLGGGNRPSLPQGNRPSISRPSVSRPSGNISRPSLPNVQRPSGGLKPSTRPSSPSFAGNRPNIGGGSRPNISLPGSGGSRPSLPGTGNFPSTRPSIPSLGGGGLSGNRPGGSLPNLPGSGNRPGTNLPGSGNRPSTLPGGRPSAGDLGDFLGMDRPVRPDTLP